MCVWWTLTWESGLLDDGRLITCVIMAVKRKRAKRREDEEAILDVFKINSLKIKVLKRRTTWWFNIWSFSLVSSRCCVLSCAGLVCSEIRRRNGHFKPQRCDVTHSILLPSRWQMNITAIFIHLSFSSSSHPSRCVCVCVCRGPLYSLSVSQSPTLMTFYVKVI